MFPVMTMTRQYHTTNPVSDENKLPLVSKRSYKPVRTNRKLKGFAEKDNVYTRLILTRKM